MLQDQSTANPQNGWGQYATPPAPRRKAFRAKLTTVRDVQGQLARLYREARSGTIPVEHASRLANVLAILGRMMVDTDLETRLAALEAQQ
jgi:hypothetical protein